MSASSLFKTYLFVLVGLFIVSQPCVVADEKEQSPPKKCQDNERLYEGMCCLDPVRIKRVNPKYPQRAQEEGAEAKVKLRAVIQVNGTVTDLKVLECTNKGLGFEKAAIKAVKRWKYQPARVDGRIRAVFITINVEFSL